MGGIQVFVAVGADHQQPVQILLAHDQVDEAQRRAAGPLQVIDDENHGTPGGGNRTQYGDRRQLYSGLRG